MAHHSCIKRCLRHLLVAAATMLPSSWHATASVTGRCDSSYSAHRYPGSDHSCGAALATYNSTVRLLGNIAHVVVNVTFSNDANYAIEDGVLTLVIPTGAILLGFSTRGTPSAEPGAGLAHGEVHLRGTNLPSCPRSSLWGGLFDGSTRAQPGTLRVSVGSIPAGGVVQAHFEYAQELKVVVRPRRGAPYRLNLQMPTGGRRKLAGQKKDNEDNAVLIVRLEVAAHECGTRACALAPLEIHSPSHSGQLQVSYDGRSKLVGSLRATSFQDVSLEVGTGVYRQPNSTRELQPAMYFERHPHTGLTAALISLPTTLAPTSPAAFEVILLLDRSASMIGARFDRVRQAAQTFLRSLPLDVSFNFVGFGFAEVAASLFQAASKVFNKETFDTALAHLSAGTKDASVRGDASFSLQKTLIGVFRNLQRHSSTQLRILLITDRQAPDADDVIREVTANCDRSTCQLFAVGLGWGASPQFVEGAARAGRGTVRFVAERGTVEPLERALVAQLAEALQLQVTDVEVDWHALDALSNSSASVSLVRPQEDIIRLSQDTKGNEENDVELQRFLSQGGVRELLPVEVNVPEVASGERTLALAFLGELGQQIRMSNDSVRVRAKVGGTPVEVSVPVSAQWEGWALHTVCAKTFADKVTHSSAKLDADHGTDADAFRSWQLRVLGLTYNLATSQTQWVASPGLLPEQRSPLRLRSKDASQCGPPQGIFGSSGSSASATGPGRPHAADDGWESESGGGQSRTLQSGPQLSVRRPPAVALADAARLSIQGLSRVATKLSILDFSHIGASLSLRAISPPSFAYGRGGLDFAAFGASMSLRSFLGFGRGFEGLDSIGASLSLKQHNRGSSPWWAGGSDADDDFYGSEYGSLQNDMWNDRYGYRYGSGLSMRQFDRFGRKIETKSLGSSLALRSLHKCGASIALMSLQRFSKKFSAMDAMQLGSSLALKGIAKPSMPSASRFGASYGGSLSTLDYLFMSSSLSLSTMGAFGRKALSLHGATRFRDPMGFGFDGGPEYSGGAHKGPNLESTLALRSCARLGKTLAVSGTSGGGHAAALPAELASKLSVLDIANLGSAVSLRRPERGNDRFGFGRRSAIDSFSGYGGFGGSDLGHLGSSLSMRRLEGARIPSEPGSYGLSDLSDLPGAGNADMPNIWDTYHPDKMESRFNSARAAGTLPTRNAGRISSFGANLPSEAAAPQSGDKADGKPTAWVGVGVAGGLVAPMLAVWRTGMSCQPIQQSVLISWPSSVADATGTASGRKKLRPAAVYAATGPLVKGGAARLTELAPPKPPASDGESVSKVQLSVSIHLSHSCMLVARPTSPAHALMGTAAASTLFEISLAREDFPAGGAPTSEALRAALSSHQRAIADDTASSVADPLQVKVYSAPDNGKGNLQALIGMQRFDGSFDFSKGTDSDVGSTGIQSAHLSALTGAWGADGSTGAETLRTMAHTAVAVALLQSRHSDVEDTWGLLAAKAEAWLVGIHGNSLVTDAAGCTSAETCIVAADLVVARWAANPLHSLR